MLPKLIPSALLLFGGATLALQPSPMDGSPGSPIESGALATEGIWELLWDDDVSGLIGETPHRATCELRFIDGKVVGRFLGKVAGTDRDAILTGESVEGGRLIHIQQREPGYACGYQLQLDERGVLWGVWHDTRGRRGDAVFRRVE